MDSGSGLTAAVIITTIVGIFTLIINRGTKISEFRQTWINDQRADFAKWGAAALALAGQRSATSRSADFATLDETAYRIRLRENPKKKEWEPVLDRMDDIRRRLIASPSTSIDIYDELKGIAAESQKRLKKDWNKVRNGEIGYSVLCFLVPAPFAVLLVMGIWAFRPDLNPFGHDAPKVQEQHVTGTVQMLPPPAPPSPQPTPAAPKSPAVAPAHGRHHHS